MLAILKTRNRLYQKESVINSTKRWVTLCRDGLPDRPVWLVMKRSLGAQPTYWYYISNAPLSSRLLLFVWLSGVHWAIEQCFEESKTELGMDHYEIRNYAGCTTTCCYA